MNISLKILLFCYMDLICNSMQQTTTFFYCESFCVSFNLIRYGKPQKSCLVAPVVDLLKFATLHLLLFLFWVQMIHSNTCIKNTVVFRCNAPEFIWNHSPHTKMRYLLLWNSPFENQNKLLIFSSFLEIWHWNSFVLR